MHKRIFESPIKTALAITSLAALVIFLITANWNWVSSNVFPNTRLGLYDKGFWENYLVEMHGMVLELALFGVLIVWLNSKRTEKIQINEYKELLTDYATLDFPEANLKKLTGLKRLNSYKVFEFSVRDMSLKDMTVNGLVFTNGSLIGMKVTNGTLKNSEFSSVQMRSSNFANTQVKTCRFLDCNLYKTNFANANCKGVSFEKSNLERSDFSGANLQSAILKNVDLRETKFHDANLNRCSLVEAYNVSTEELAKAKSLDYIAVSDSLLDELIKLRPDMKYQKRRK